MYPNHRVASPRQTRRASYIYLGVSGPVLPSFFIEKQSAEEVEHPLFDSGVSVLRRVIFVVMDLPDPPLYRNLEWQQLNKPKFILYNSIVFFFIRAALHPANVVKTRFQMQKRHDQFSTPFRALVHTFRTGGIRALYAGWGTASLMLGVQQIYLVTYESLRSPECSWPPDTAEPIRNGIAAASAVLVSQIFGNPIDVVSQRLMLREQLADPPSASPGTPGGSAPRPKGAFEAALQVYRLRGLRGFYTGFAISCLQFVPSASLWWASYPLFRGAYSQAVLSTLDESSPSGPLTGWNARAAEVLAGASSSAVVAVAIAPFDIIRTRAQVEGLGGLTVARQLIQTEGVRGLWKGVGARIVTLMPQGAVSVSAYEQVKRWSELR